jgi:4'-phosphopantetheinyl transferase
LSLYTNIPPKQLKFFEGSHGKPELTLSPDKSTVRFNLSDSREVALIAVTRGRQIGIDIEHVQKDFEWNGIAERFFSASEVAMIQALSPEHQQEAFFRCWTRKEAYIKARGQGLSIPLNQFDVSVIPGERPRLSFPNNDAPDSTCWYLQELVPFPEYVATLAIEGDNCDVKAWEWTSAG